ncbi:uncharacterized protein LOC129942731 [Eupeodes corollae]|uniref:uncharacterized protein LOC129942731 n=1 Tax=Eupeodes corollae TaxID=290404 RepID=UPI0024933028|nr:uncharacterized protein LOC129942731 [Eupeodes corollae]
MFVMCRRQASSDKFSIRRVKVIKSNTDNPFRHDFTRKVFVYFMKTKDAVLNCFREFKAEVENQQESRIKILRIDNGTEFINKAMQLELKKSGIVHQTTVPLPPEQNGLAERMNRTLIEKARAMFLQKKDVFISRDVVFHEDNFHYKIQNENTNEVPKYTAVVGVHPIEKQENLVIENDYESCSSNPEFEEGDNEEDPSVATSSSETHDPVSTLSVQFDVGSQQIDEDNPDLPEAGESALSLRSERILKLPRVVYNAETVNILEELEDMEDMLSRDDKEKWKEAMQSEMKSFEENDTWKCVDKPAGANIIKTKWVFKKKLDEMDNVRY